MEQRPRVEVRSRCSLAAAVAATVAALAGAGIVSWLHKTEPRTGEQKAVGPTVIARSMAAFVEHYCPLAQNGNAVSPASGWVRYRDAKNCFTFDYPKGWRTEENQAAVYFWADTSKSDGKTESFWNADVVIERPHGTLADERAEYESFAKDVGVKSGGSVLGGPWKPTVNGDGSPSAAVTQVRKAFTGRGEFVIVLLNKTGNATRAALLEKIADTFKAQ